MALSPQERRKIGRALWAYSEQDQKPLAEKAGIKYDRLRAALNDDAKSPPTTDELLALAEAAEVPDGVVIHGWGQRVDAAEHAATVDAQITELRAGLAALAADSLRHTKELEELRGKGRLGKSKPSDPQ